VVTNWPPRWLTPVPEVELANGEGQLVIDFAEAFGIVTKDSIAGKAGSPLNLREWQKELIRHVFAGDGDGYRHRISLIGMPRKNGKSALGSVFGLYSLILGARGAEVYSVAAEKEQARIVFADAKRMVEASPELSGITKLYRDAIELPHAGSVYRVLSAEAYSKEGLNPSATIFDELHAQPSRELFDVMSLAMGARGRLATLIAITTAGVKADSTGQDSIAYNLYQYGQKVARAEVDDPTFFMSWWEADAEADHREPKTWQDANPGFGDICSAEDFESAVRRTPEPEFRTKRCNQWVASALSWLPTGTWDTCEGDTTIDGKDYILGLDGSFSGDATVVTYSTIEETPQVGIVGAWEKDSNIHDDTWRVDVLEVEETIRRFVKANPNVKEIACDPYRWTRTMQVLQDEGYPIVEYPSTNARRMVVACSKFYDAVMDQKIVHDGNPLLARHLSNAVIKVDNLGPRIVKENRASQRRIDAAVAVVMAFDRATASRIEEEPLVPQFFA
jgi:phage terminase large subunit-like protein